MAEQADARLPGEAGELRLRHSAEIRARAGEDVRINVMRRDGELPARPAQPSADMLTRPVERI